jgi:asparagine synthase (glutamine-hydrolysing)
MCGICGITNFNNKPITDTDLNKMMKVMKHRGPDDDGIFIDNNVGMGFVRLSIIDLTEAGHQPMFSEDGRFVITFNGEIYNYIELREELKTKFNFKTDTDTEVLLNAYRHWGKDCLDHLNGMWAFVVYDKQEKKLFCSRDRFGIKPFYYFYNENTFIYGSDISSILEVLPEKPQPDNQTIYDFLAFNRTDQNERTFFSGIKKLQHGSTLTLNNGKPVIEKWYDLSNKTSSKNITKDDFKELLINSIELRMRSDVPVGICLSGGLDSSAIASILSRNLGFSSIQTFSAIYGKGLIGDESSFMNEFSNEFPKMNFITLSAESLLEDFDSFLAAHTEPFPDLAVYSQFKVMQLAKGKAVVLLDGQGADEYLAGYHYFFSFLFKELLLKLKYLNLFKEMNSYFKVHKSLASLKTFAYILLPDILKIRLNKTQKGFFNKEFYEKFSRSNKITNTLYSANSIRESVLAHFEYKLEHLLKWEDRNSMWYSLESRVPFLDYRLVESVLNLKPEDVISGGLTKKIMREALKGTLPERIRNRKDKIGFSNPKADWLRTKEMKDKISDILQSKEFEERGYIDPILARNIFNNHQSKQTDSSKDIWKWTSLELWFRKYIDS